jgi:hypothetical protein
LEVAIDSGSDGKNETKQFLLFIFIIFAKFPIYIKDLHYQKIGEKRYIIFTI